MNSRGFLRFRMLVEFIIGLALAAATVDTDRVLISGHVFLDVLCRLAFAILAFVIFANCVTLQREVRAR